jgi:Tol biopolymer transport system component/DNA-binding winged helix-turn-helix (wHTH) protein
MTENRSDRLRFGPYEVDLHTHELWKFGTRLKLVGQPFAVLGILLRHPGELVTREKLRDHLWPSDTFVDFNHGLNSAVNKLRETLSDSAEDPKYIETLPRRGYRFIAKVEAAEAKPIAARQPELLPTESPAIPLEQLVIASEGSSHDPSLSRPALSRYFIGAGVLFTALLTGLLLIHSISGAAPAERSLPEPMRPLFDIANTSSPAFSPDGNSVAFQRDGSGPNNSGIYVAPVGSDQAIQLSSGDDDCCPVWSPDGRWIAFSRVHNHDYSIHLVPANGGGEPERRAERDLSFAPVSPGVGLVALAAVKSVLPVDRTLDTAGFAPHRGEIDWSPDGQSIAFSGPDGIYLAKVASRFIRRITESPAGVEEWGPRFSADGDTLLFVRTHPIGAPDEIWAVSVRGEDEHLIFSERGKITSPPQWSFNSGAIIFSSNRTGHPVIWRVSLDDPSDVVEVAEAGSPSWDPTVSRRGYRLAYERLMRALSIWQMDVTSADKRPALLVSSTSNTDQGPGPQFSPDSTKLAYMSDRSGTMEIWISNRDGSDPYQLSAVGGAGTPRWSPDGQFVAFDTVTQQGSKIVVMNVRGGAPRTLTPDTFNDVCPSWSRDGRWVYFGSYRSQGFQVWKVPSQGGTAIQVTRYGGHAAMESLDGKVLYYAKSQFAEPEIWSVPVGGGEEKVVPLVRPGTWASWQVVKDGIIFVGPALGHQAVLSFYDFSKQLTTQIAVLDRVPFWLGATRDGHTVAFDQPGREQSQAMLVENFR